MRKPMAKGLASMNTRRCSSMRNVSRELWPSASTTCRLCSVSPLASTTPSTWPVLDEQVGDPALEAHLAAERDDLLAHRRDDAGEAEGADVRLADVEDLRRRAGAHEFVHHLAAVELRILDLAVELAVGEQARAALAELHVGLRRQVFWRHSAQVSWVRRRTSRPRSSTMGLKPICASSSAANSPQGPKPTTSGRSLSCAGACATGW